MNNINSTQIVAFPPLHWVGGKREILGPLNELKPFTFNSFYEPMVGAGAMYLNLQVKNSHISDMNEELIIMYQVIKENPEGLIEHLKTHLNEEEYYCQLRDLDRDIETFESLSKLERASRIMFMSKAGFNGLYRVNSKGFNNVAYGTKKKISFDAENIRACSKVLQNTTIKHQDFTAILPNVKAGDFVYLDPPYIPLEGKKSFTQYTKEGFKHSDQVRLKKFCDELTSRGVYFMQSNSYTDTTLSLYGDYHIEEVLVGRTVNCKADKRGKVKEAIITNYNPRAVNNQDFKILSNQEVA